MIFKSN